jgi:cytochrome c553
MKNREYQAIGRGAGWSGGVSIAVVLLLAVAGMARADGGSVRAVAANCATCHGTQGVSASVLPSLAGRPSEELYRLLLEFKNDQRKGSVMNQHAKGYADAELWQLAEYFSAQRSVP